MTDTHDWDAICRRLAEAQGWKWMVCVHYPNAPWNIGKRDLVSPDQFLLWEYEANDPELCQLKRFQKAVGDEPMLSKQPLFLPRPHEDDADAARLLVWLLKPHCEINTWNQEGTWVRIDDHQKEFCPIRAVSHNPDPQTAWREALTLAADAYVQAKGDTHANRL